MALEDENFSGTVAHNTIGVRLMGEVHHPDWGTGQVTLGPDGTPSGLIFAHVDDFLIHATSQLRCRLALEAVMEMTVRLGLICQPCKTSPPAQLQKYTGFLFDTRDIPCGGMGCRGCRTENPCTFVPGLGGLSCMAGR